jgi:hypothetical protein
LKIYIVVNKGGTTAKWLSTVGIQQFSLSVPFAALYCKSQLFYLPCNYLPYSP